MIRRYAAELRALFILSDALLAVAVFAFASWLRFGPEWRTYWSAVIRPAELVAGVYALAWVTALGLGGLYRPRFRWTTAAQAVDILKAAAWVALGTVTFLFAAHLADVSRRFLLVLFPSQVAVTILSRIILRLAFRRLRAGGRNTRNVLVVGAGELGRAFAQRLEAHPWLGLRVVGFLEEDDELAAALPEGWARLGGLDRMERLFDELVIDEVAVCVPQTAWDDRVDALVRLAEDEGKAVRVPLGLVHRPFLRGQYDELDGIPVYSIVAGPDREIALAAKRALDLAGAALGLVFLSPIFALVALAILVAHGRPVLFTQERVGLHGRRFRIVKFRTMVPDAELRYTEVAALSDTNGAAFKMADDPRTTRLGRLLRKTSLDELPQFWNVLRGEMSLVGPRPAPAREVSGYDPWHRRRLSMKPGITGLWQVGSRFDEDFDQRASLDLAYIDRWSLALDLWILARTVPAVIAGTGR